MKKPTISFTKKDFKVDWFSGTGAGGQHRNKHQNCCRITHLETGITSTGQSHRDRPSNQREAFNSLSRKLITLYVATPEKNRYNGTERIRTYHEPRNIVIDHASGTELTYKEVVESGNIDKMITARKTNIK